MSRNPIICWQNVTMPEIPTQPADLWHCNHTIIFLWKEMKLLVFLRIFKIVIIFDCFYLLYISLHFSLAIGVLIHGFGIALGAVHASRLLQSTLLGSILHAPMSFFDTTPLGKLNVKIKIQNVS